MLARWNYKTHAYDPFTPPDDWKVILYSEDMGKDINCANCGKPMTYGEGFTSQEIHTPIGLGYPVCEKCHQFETARKERQP